MTIQLSTAVRTGMLNSTGFSEGFTNGVIEIRSGPQPANADAAATGILLGLVTDASGAFTPGVATNGLTFATAVAGVITKTLAQVWSFNAIADGTAGYFRLRGNAADAGGVSTTLWRMDGSIANSGADMLMANVSIVTDAPDVITQFQYTLPAS